MYHEAVATMGRRTAQEGDGTAWYALRVQPQKEFMVAYLLRQRGAHTYVPTELRARRRNRYAKATDQMAYPVLPGCVFAGFTESPNWFAVTSNPLVLGTIGHDGVPWQLDLVELLRWRTLVPDGCLVLHRPIGERAMRLVRIEGKGVYRSPHERPHFISARKREQQRDINPGQRVVKPTRQQAEYLMRFLRPPEPLRAAA